MNITYDKAKSDKNIAERGLSFDLAADLDWAHAVIVEDTRKNYGERRFRIFANLDNRLHVLVFTPRNGGLHVISFRKANNREVKEHGNSQT